MNFFKYYFGILAGLILATGIMSAQGEMGVFDSQTDVGNCKNKGFAIFNPTDQTYLVGGSGANMWFGRDEFHYLWTTLQGDFILRAELTFLGKGVNPHRKAGWVVRNTLDDNAPQVNATVHGSGLTSLQYRKIPAGTTEEIVSPDSFPDVIQLERKGNTFIMSVARFGEPFTRISLDSMMLDHEVFAGIYVCSHNPDIVETATFRNVRIIRAADPGLQPYHDYLGSHLEILDIASGLRKIIFSANNSIQAPNWTPDGKKLIYNSKGHLFQYILKNGTVQPLNTGFATRCNNDHVLTFDGTLLGISNTDNHSGKSAIYYLPATGNSTPVRVTKPGADASYLHGWAPDNKTMVFTGYRNGKFNIFSADIHTGKETQLTDQAVLDDGPEYSPDGKYIFFNSARTGKMKIWRMDPDGKNKVQLTFGDEYNDWFPHVSPDRKWIVFISFPKEVDPQDHPFYKHCLLRIMPYEGGNPRVLAYIYGGQGTINVPSWSPDSQRIAFVTNTGMQFR